MGWLRDGFEQIWGSWQATYHERPTTLGLGDHGLRVALWGEGASCSDYAGMYRSNPTVRACVDFLARNIAQLPIQVFERQPDDSRTRVRDGLADLLVAPNATTTIYQFINATVSDVCIYGYGLWAKVRPERGGLQLVRVPPSRVRVVYVTLDGEIIPGIEWDLTTGGKSSAALRDLVHFKLYDPDPASLGLSPLASLCDLTAVERSVAQYLKSYWQAGARPSAVIERPLDAPRWTPPARKQFAEDLYEAHAGPSAAGRIVVLEDGMTMKGISHTASESDLLAWHKLTREEIAGTFHIPAQAIGITEGSMSFASAKEMHKVVYQDCLMPWTVMIEQEINRALLPEFGDPEHKYCEFLIEEKLRGSHEEQTLAIRMLTGTAILSVNEARARFNLPRVEGEGYDVPLIPLNLATGGDVNEVRELAKLTGEAA